MLAVVFGEFTTFRSAILQFVVMAQLGWAGSRKALIVPAVINAFGILLDASVHFGCGARRIAGIFTFISVWNNYRGRSSTQVR